MALRQPAAGYATAPATQSMAAEVATPGSNSSLGIPGLRTFSRTIRLVMLSATLALVSSFALPVAAANASGISCPVSGQDFFECTDVHGSGLKITNIVAHVTSYVAPTPNVHIEIYGPHGHIANSAEYTQLTGTGPNFTYWVPNPTANQAAGDYCSTAWQRLTNGSYKELTDRACVLVHT
jgi:hypothetical protein